MIPNAYYDNIFEIDYKKIKNIGIKNIFFDIDNTVVPYKVTNVNKKTIKLFKDLKKDFNIFLYSNSGRKRTMGIAKQLGVGAYYFSMKPLKITTPYITLQQLLKIEDIISSGGEAKFYLAENPVLVNGELENRRGRKLYPKDVIKVDNQEFIIE